MQQHPYLSSLRSTNIQKPSPRHPAPNLKGRNPPPNEATHERPRSSTPQKVCMAICLVSLVFERNKTSSRHLIISYHTRTFVPYPITTSSPHLTLQLWQRWWSHSVHCLPKSSAQSPKSQLQQVACLAKRCPCSLRLLCGGSRKSAASCVP